VIIDERSASPAPASQAVPRHRDQGAPNLSHRLPSDSAFRKSECKHARCASPAQEPIAPHSHHSVTPTCHSRLHRAPARFKAQESSARIPHIFRPIREFLTDPAPVSHYLGVNAIRDGGDADLRSCSWKMTALCAISAYPSLGRRQTVTILLSYVLMRLPLAHICYGYCSRFEMTLCYTHTKPAPLSDERQEYDKLIHVTVLPPS
jgi:hypothetical protein